MQKCANSEVTTAMQVVRDLYFLFRTPHAPYLGLCRFGTIIPCSPSSNNDTDVTGKLTSVLNGTSGLASVVEAALGRQGVVDPASHLDDPCSLRIETTDGSQTARLSFRIFDQSVLVSLHYPDVTPLQQLAASTSYGAAWLYPRQLRPWRATAVLNVDWRSIFNGLESSPEGKVLLHAVMARDLIPDGQVRSTCGIELRSEMYQAYSAGTRAQALYYTGMPGLAQPLIYQAIDYLHTVVDRDRLSEISTVLAPLIELGIDYKDHDLVRRYLDQGCAILGEFREIPDDSPD